MFFPELGSSGIHHLSTHLNLRVPPTRVGVTLRLWHPLSLKLIEHV